MPEMALMPLMPEILMLEKEQNKHNVNKKNN